MYKFKFEPPQEHRRSLQNPKNDHVALLNTLDKCTQILRQDRLWIRNELKQNNQALLALFKEHPKHSQLQGLQVKLRKHVQGVKARIKQDQLARFRETFHHEGTQMVQPERAQPPQSYSRPAKPPSSHLRSTPSLQLTRTSKSNKHNRSQEASPCLNSTSTVFSQKRYGELLRQKYSKDVIEERESENVTSARLRRDENEGGPLKELKSNFNNTGLYGAFFQGKGEVQQANYESEGGSLPWHFQQKAKQTLYEQQAEKEQLIPDISQGFSRIDRSGEDKDDSIFDRHFNDSAKVSTRYDFSQPSCSNDFKNSMLESRGESAKFQLKEFNPTREQHFESTDENLFTPQELLNQCRNFLKHREQPRGDHLQAARRDEPELSSPGQEQLSSLGQEQPECIFNRNNCREAEKAREEEESYVYPQVPPTDPKKEDNFVYPHFETFANSSGQKHRFEKATSPPKLTLPVPRAKQVSISQSFSIEQFLEDLMDHNDMDIFLSLKSLREFLGRQPEAEALENALGRVVDKERICVVEVAEQIEAAIRVQGRAYGHCDEAVNSVYNLLDISQKGEICLEDVQSFLQQFEEAEVANFEEVSSGLLRLFRGADFSNEERLSYWHFFVVRESEQFREVSQLLGQFQFQIEQE